MVRTGFVTGLAVEASVLRRQAASDDPNFEILIACAGADAFRARRMADDLLDAGAGALVSFGIAGGLDPALEAGEVVLPEAVVMSGGPAVMTDPVWRRRLLDMAAAKGLRPRGGKVAGSDQAVATVAGKRALFEESGAIAVDMESHAVALAAQAAGVPFLVVRAIIDPAQRALPWAVLGTIAPNGRARKRLVIARLFLRPWEVPQVNRLRKDSGTALAALGEFIRALAPALTVYPTGP